ncbi:carbonic anhydrase [Micromonospora arborensis]
MPTLPARSSIIAEKARQGALRVVGGRYDLDNSRVSLVAWQCPLPLPSPW